MPPAFTGTKNKAMLYCKLPQKQYVLKVDKVFDFKSVKNEKSQFTPTQIASILKEFDGGKQPNKLTGNMVSVEHPFINVDNAMVAWKPVSSNGSKNWKWKTPG